MEISGKNKDYTLTDVVFVLAPRINAAGRMDHASQAVKMLICDARPAGLGAKFIHQPAKHRAENF